MIRQKIFNKKALVVLNICLLTVVLLHSILRDRQLEKHYCWDIRNRVVGTRLQKDGKIPYYYHWNRNDGVRYYDQFNITREGPSNITSSPFFHRLFYSVCDMPQASLSLRWFWFQYILLASITLLMIPLAILPAQRLLILNAAILFTCTAPWQILIATGQSYLLTTFLISCICFFLHRYNKKTSAAAAFCAVVFILIRPIGLIFFLPFALQFRKYARFLILAFAGLGLYGIFIAGNAFEKVLWRNYFSAVRTQATYHLGTDSALLIPETERVEVDQLEGLVFDKKTVRDSYYSAIAAQDELANAYAVYSLLWHKKMPLPALNFILCCILFVLASLYYYHRKNLTPLQIIIFSFLLYMLVEICSPIKRHEYYPVQWLPLLMAALLIIRDWKDPVFILLVTGFILNTGYIYPISRPLLLGELCWLAAILLISCRPAGSRHRLPATASGR